MTTIVAAGFISRRTAVSQLARERVIFGEIGELVPVVVDRVDQALIGTRQRAFELQIIGRIGEDEVDRGFGQRVHLRHAVADQDRVARGGRSSPSARRIAAGRFASPAPVRET